MIITKQCEKKTECDVERVTDLLTDTMSRYADALRLISENSAASSAWIYRVSSQALYSNDTNFPDPY